MNPSKATNPLDYPRYVRGLRPALPESLGFYVEDELEKLQNSTDNLAVAADSNSSAKVTVERLERETADESLAQQITTVNSDFNDNRAAVEQRLTALTTADSAFAEDLTSLSTAVGENTSSVAFILQSIDGTQALAILRLSVNNEIVGFTVNGQDRDFTVIADTFRVKSTTGAGGDTIFEVTPDYVRFKGKLLVDDVKSGTLQEDINVGAGHVIFNNGTVMRVQGTGFGSSGQFVDWFGPSLPSYNQCTEALAIQYLKTDGSAYFGGSLSAGTLFNSTRSTDTAPTASATLGPYGTNGGQKMIVASYSYQANYTFNQSFAATGDPSATLNLYRGSTATSANLVATINAAGSVSPRSGVGGPGEPTGSSVTMSGAVTITDNDPSGADRMYHLVIASRNGPSFDADAASLNVSQVLSLSSTEQ